MKNKITIVCTARMGHGTFEAKFYPLINLDRVQKIVVLRKDRGPAIPKLVYKVLPGICKNPVVNLFLAPFYLIREIHKNQADLILAYHYQPHFYFAYFVSLITGKPYIIGQTGTDVQDLAERPIKGALLRHIVRNAMSFNVPGIATRKFWLSKGVQSNRLRVLHSTINTDHFVPDDGDKKYDFVFVGRLTEVKRLDKLIRVAAILVKEFPLLKICIVGSGHLEHPLKKMVSDLQLNEVFDFVGLQTNIKDWLNQGHAFVMTSDTEGLPCAMMEAMSCGLLCIGPLVNNMADLLVENKTGFGFQTHDEIELTRVMKHIMTNRSNMNEIRIAARDLIIREHSYIVAQSLWTELLDQL